jgi:hypothetical protein
LVLERTAFADPLARIPIIKRCGDSLGEAQYLDKVSVQGRTNHSTIIDRSVRSSVVGPSWGAYTNGEQH